MSENSGATRGDFNCAIDVHGNIIESTCVPVDLGVACISPSPSSPPSMDLSSLQIALPASGTIVGVVASLKDTRGYVWVASAILVVALTIADRTGLIPLTMSQRLRQRFAALDKIDRDLELLKVIVSDLPEAELLEALSIVTLPTIPNQKPVVMSYSALRSEYGIAVSRACDMKVQIETGSMLRGVQESFPRISGRKTWAEMLDLVDSLLRTLNGNVLISTSAYSQAKIKVLERESEQRKENLDKKAAEEDKVPLEVFTEASFACEPVEQYEAWARSSDPFDF